MTETSRTLDLATQLRRWVDGIPYEVAFWRRWLATRGDRWPEDFARRVDPSAALTPLLGRWVRPAAGEPVRVLDVGAGPITSVGYVLEGRQVAITPTDPLAHIYARLCAEADVTAPAPTIFAVAEDLGAFFAPEQFDLVHCRNALDHSFDPLRGIEQMLAVTRIGGRVVLSHHRNEAEAERYAGFHQFNFEIQDDRFVIWNRTDRIDVATALACPCQVRALPSGMVDVVIEKTGAAPEGGPDAPVARLRSYLAAFVAAAASAGGPASSQGGSRP